MWPPMPCVFAVGPRDHRHRVPADDALDAPLDLAIARIRRLLVGGDGVDVGRRGGERQLDARLVRRLVQLRQQIIDSLRAFAVQNVVSPLSPLLGSPGKNTPPPPSSSALPPLCSPPLDFPGATTPPLEPRGAAPPASPTWGDLPTKRPPPPPRWCPRPFLRSWGRRETPFPFLSRFFLGLGGGREAYYLFLGVFLPSYALDRPISLIIRYLRKPVKGEDVGWVVGKTLQIAY